MKSSLLKYLVTYGAAVVEGKVIVGFLVWLMAVGTVSADPLRVLAFGDSLTQGYGLPESEGFVPQLEHWLHDQGADVAVINAGVSGDTTAGGAARIDWSLADNPDAMILTLGGNDMLRGIDPAVSRANLERILDAAGDLPVLLVGLKAPDNYGADFKEGFDGMYAALASAYGLLLYEDFFGGMGVATPAEARDLMQEDGIHPNAEGVARIVEAIGPSVLELLELVDGK